MPDWVGGDGVPSRVDLGSPDVDASISFYGSLFGWTPSDPGPPEAGGYSATPDGRRFLVVLPSGGPALDSPFTVVMNWTAGLKR